MNHSLLSILSMALAVVFCITCASAAAPQDDDLNSIFSNAYVAFEKGELEAAENWIKEFIEIVPFEPSSRIFLARCQAKQDNLDGAIESLMKAAQLGWEDVASIRQDVVLTQLTEHPSFKKLIGKIEDNRRRKYVIHIGKTVRRDNPAPLIVLYHGRGELPNIQLHFWKDAADRAGWIVLTMKGTRQLGSVYAWERNDAKKTWQIDTPQIISETKSRIAELCQSHKVSEIVLAGFSQGGVAAFETLRSGEIASARGAVLFATAFPESPEMLMGKTAQTPNGHLSIHVGANDQWSKGNQAIVAFLRQHGISHEFRIWPELGHQMPPDHTQVIVESVKSILNHR